MVLVAGAALLLTAIVLALTARVPADFGPTGTRADVSAAIATTRVTAGVEVDPPGHRTVPLVPAEARRPAAVVQPLAAAPPVGLQIPAVDIEVDVVAVGVDDDGQMEIPVSGQEVGWYRYGAAPGEGQGSAVLASHVDTLAEGRGVLARLTELDAGDLVSVTLADGSVLDYRVTGRRTVAKTDLDTGLLFDRSGPEQLQLVTCGGPWQPERSSYRDNVIVAAEPVTS